MEESLADGNNVFDDKWTRSIAVGSEQFVHQIKEELGRKALARRIREVSESMNLRNWRVPISHFSASKREDITGIDILIDRFKTRFSEPGQSC